MFQDLNPLDKPTAMIEILIMITGAALIGFFIGWLFHKLQRDKLKADLRFTRDKLNAVQSKSDESTIEHSELRRLAEDLRSRKDALFNELEVQKEETKKLEAQLNSIQTGVQPPAGMDADTETEIPEDASGPKEAEIADELETTPEVVSPTDAGNGEATEEMPSPSLSAEDFQERKHALLNSVGKATEAEKDNFSKISGIGPFIEAKLNSIGIFTYDQIARFGEEDIDNVTRLIEFFPGRIERDGWVSQAADLLLKNTEGEKSETPKDS